MLFLQGSDVSGTADSKNSYPTVHFTNTYGQAISYYATYSIPCWVAAWDMEKSEKPQSKLRFFTELRFWFYKQGFDSLTLH